MWKNTVRSKIVQRKPIQKAENKVLTKPPFKGVDFILPGGFDAFSDYGPDISEITYFTVLRVLSEAVGKMPFHIRDKNHKIVTGNTERLLTVRPNDSMSPVQLWSFLEFARNHYGNSYLYCNWSDQTGKLKSVHALDPRLVRVWVDDVSGDIVQKHYYTYTSLTGQSYVLASEDVAHFKTWHLDEETRLIGLPVRITLHDYMTSSKAGQETQSNLWKNGLISSGVLSYVGDLNNEQKEQMLESIRKIGTKNKILPLPKEWDLKPINMSLVDAQFVEGRKLNALQIAAAFGVSPIQLNDYSKGSYANSTSQQLAFLTDTLLYISRQYEDEMTYKLLSEQEIDDGLRVDIDTESVLKSTPDVLSTILAKMVQSSIMTINEARDRAGLEPLPDCDKLMTMPGATTLEKEVVTEL